MNLKHLLFFLSGLFAILLFFGMGFASQIEDHSVTVHVDDDFVAHFDVVMTFIELNTEKLNYLVFAHVENASARDVLGELDCDLDKQTYGTQISCIPNSQMKENYTVWVMFDSDDLVRKRGAAELFSYGYGIKDPTNYFAVKIFLPEGAALLSAVDFDPYYPEGAHIETEMGRRVSLEWDVMKPELGRTYNFDSHFEFVGKVPVDEPIGDDVSFFDGPYLFYFGLVLLVFLLAALWRWYLKRDGGGVKRVFSVLKDDERTVIDVVIEKGDKCKQRDIVRVTDFSKAKVSRIMSELESRGILSRVRVGRTNRVILSENIDRKPVKSNHD